MLIHVFTLSRQKDDLQSFVEGDQYSGLIYDGFNLFNPFYHYGRPDLYPQGYPLSAIGGDQDTTYGYAFLTLYLLIYQKSNLNLVVKIK